MTPTARRLAVLVAATAVLAVAPACARAGDTLGAGPDVDLCTGWRLVDELDEPDLADRAATLRWAEGVGRIIDRVDLRREVDDEPVPRAVARHLEVVEEAIGGFAGTLRDGGDDALEPAFDELTTGDYAPAGGRVTDFTRARC